MSLARAIETGDLAGLPSRRSEDWRWTDLRGLIREAPAPSPPWTGELPPGLFAGMADREVALVNGRGEDHLDVPPGTNLTAALRLVTAPNAGGHVARLTVRLGEGARLTLLESHEGLGEAYLSDAELEFELGPQARLERIVLAEEAEGGVAVVRAEVRLGAGARIEQCVLVAGARRQRIETRIAHPGAGAHVRLDGVYLLADRRHADITTIVAHDGVGGSTDQLVKGVVAGQARGVFQGRIVVARGADQTDARMGHHALILSDQAEVDAKPELEIFADDVSCSHGNTIGALDKEALFYAAQRGIPEPQARAMLTLAFVGEVIDRIAHEGAREIARTWAERRLGGAS